MRKGIIILAAFSIAANTPVMPVYADGTAEELTSPEYVEAGAYENSDSEEFTAELYAENANAIKTAYIEASEYTVGNGYILGVTEGMAVEDFLSELVCAEEPVVYEGSTANVRTDNIKNGDTVAVSGKKYVIETNIYPNREVFFDTFDDSTTGSWSGGASLKVTDDSEKGRVLSVQIPGAAANAEKTFTASRRINADNAAVLLVFEYDVKFPAINGKDWVGLLMRNSADKFLATMRLFPNGDMKALYTGALGYQTMYTGVRPDTWYNIKYVMSTKTGLCDMYVNDELVIEKSEMQAIKNSPGNYIPSKLELTANRITSEDIPISIDNVELYTPTAVKTDSITINKGEQRINVLERVPVDFDSVKVKLSCDNKIDTSTLDGNIRLADGSGKTVACDITVNPQEPSYTVKPKGILKTDSEYTIVMSGITDTEYKTEYKKSYSFTTDSNEVKAKVVSVTAKSGGEEYIGISNIRTDTDMIEIALALCDGISIGNAENAIGIYSGDSELDTVKSFDPVNNIFTIAIKEPLISGGIYTLKIDDLQDNGGDTVLSCEYSMRAVAAWVVSAGDVLYSDEYSVSDGEISGIPQGTTAGELWSMLKSIPGTTAKVYEDSSLNKVNTGYLSNGNVIKAYNSFTEETKTYTLSLTGCKLSSDSYNIYDNTISGVENGTKAEDFISKLDMFGADSYEIIDKSGIGANVLTDGCTLKIKSGSKSYGYKIQTVNNDDTVYYSADFENGTGGWSSGSVINDPEKGNVLSWTISGAAQDSQKSASANLTTLSIGGSPEILVFETDIKLPVLPKSTVAIQMKNSKDKYLAVLRIDQKELFYTLVPNGQANIAEGMKENTWYHIKYVNNCKNGTMDIYLDGKLMASELKYQATDDFIPATMNISVGSTAVNGTVLEIDNMTLYEPNPIKLGYVDVVKNGAVNADLNKVPYDADEINVRLTVAKGSEIQNSPEECIELTDKDGNTVPADKTYDKESTAVKLVPKEVLDCDSDYYLKANGIIDDVYKKSFGDEVILHTAGFDTVMTDSFIMTESGDIANSFTGDKMTVHAPFANIVNGKKTVFMLTLFDKNGRLITCSVNETDTEAASLNEAVFNVDLTDSAESVHSAKIFARESDGGPLFTPYGIVLK